MPQFAGTDCRPAAPWRHPDDRGPMGRRGWPRYQSDPPVSRILRSMEVTVAKRHERHGQANIADAINEAKGNDFRSLLGDRTEDWWSFVRERLDLGASQ